MFDGRHCTYKDLDLLNKETEKMISVLRNENDEIIKKQIHVFLNLIKRFDAGIAYDMQRQITMANNDRKRIESIVIYHTNTLVQNVIVDINEHR